MRWRNGLENGVTDKWMGSKRTCSALPADSNDSRSCLLKRFTSQPRSYCAYRFIIAFASIKTSHLGTKRNKLMWNCVWAGAGRRKCAPLAIRELKMNNLLSAEKGNHIIYSIYSWSDNCRVTVATFHQNRLPFHRCAGPLRSAPNLQTMAGDKTGIVGQINKCR